MAKPEVGYRRPTKLYEIEFEDGELAGFWMQCRMVDLGRFNAIADMAEVESGAGKLPSKQDREKLTALCEAFGRALLDWNLETEDGEPVPVSELVNQDIDFVMGLVTQWMNAVSPAMDNMAEGVTGSASEDGPGEALDGEWLSQLPMHVG